MRAILIDGIGGPEVLSLGEVAPPEPGAKQLLVRVHASAINRADLLQCQGRYPAPPGVPEAIPGLEYAGEVIALGEGVTQWRCGDRVMGIVGGGAGAELVCVHEDEALPVPAALSFEEAAAIPEAFLTAYDAACLQGKLEAGQCLGFNAAGSGVGTALIQIAAHIGAHTIGSSRTESKLHAAAELGLNHPVLGSSDALATAIKASSAAQGADVIVDFVGGPALSALIGAAAYQGSLIIVGLLGGLKSEISLGHVLMKRLRIQGTVLRSRALREKAELVRQFRAHLIDSFEGPEPSLRPVIDHVRPWTEVAEAHQALASNATFGKIVLMHTR